MGERDSGAARQVRSMGERDSGAASLIVVAVLGIVLVVVSAAAAVTRLAVARVQLSAAADLAALAAATEADCSAAQSVALANGATLLDCSRDGPDFSVRAAVEVTVLPGPPLSLTARARAGPPQS